MIKITLHLPKTQKQTKKLSDVINPLPDTLTKYQDEEVTVITTTEEEYPFTISGDLLKQLPELLYEIGQPITFNTTSIKCNKNVVTKALFSSTCSFYCLLNQMLYNPFNLYSKDEYKSLILNVYTLSKKLHANIKLNNPTMYNEYIHQKDYSFLDNEDLYIKNIKTQPNLHNKNREYLALLNQILNQARKKYITFPAIDIIGPHITVDFYIPCVTGYDKNLNFYNKILNSIKEIDLKDKTFGNNNVGNLVSINNRINALYNYFLTTQAKIDIDNIFKKEDVIETSTPYINKARCFSYPSTVNPDPIIVSDIKRANIVKEKHLTTMLSSTFIFEKYLSTLTNFITTDSQVHTEILNLLIYGTYIISLLNGQPNISFKRRYDTRIKVEDNLTLYFCTSRLTVAPNFKTHLLKNPKLFNTHDAFLPMFLNSSLASTVSKVKTNNLLLTKMGKK